MLVSDHRATLEAAKSARALTCYFAKRVPGAPTKLPMSYTVSELTGVQECIEDRNGITYRDADTEIRTRYGVNSTA